MNFTIAPKWKPYLEEEFEKEYFKQLKEFVDREYEEHICYPKKEQIFEAFNACSLEDTKVVIIGQDPYHEENQANGLCFSVNDGVQHPKSLRNIFDELTMDLKVKYPVSGNLSPWAKQGVLLLNATLTVRAKEEGSHQKKGWEQFTNTVIDVLSEEKDNLVFLLWGGFARKKGARIDTDKHKIFTSGHPSPASASRGYWFGNRHFSKTNTYLKSKGIPEIDWSIS
ncbi:uracil-DNA glycosylase [Ochrovirga pacifica]|uniref:uracil-DNA glycosylase n=1 Tax=Ochrovirga pacifica TaxID=1042376 RepID=UPI000255A7A0|nr:uracil-DNA glycosylase [Ochrovirga pacifica]